MTTTATPTPTNRNNNQNQNTRQNFNAHRNKDLAIARKTYRRFIKLVQLDQEHDLEDKENFCIRDVAIFRDRRDPSFVKILTDDIRRGGRTFTIGWILWLCNVESDINVRFLFERSIEKTRYSLLKFYSENDEYRHPDELFTNGRYTFNLTLDPNPIIFERRLEALQFTLEDEIRLEALWPLSGSMRQYNPNYVNQLRPISRHPLPTFIPINQSLADDQKRAVVNILQAKNRPNPYVLFGPPGTGKTVTLVETILQIHWWDRNLRILVCGNTNDCADQLAAALLAKLKTEKQKFGKRNNALIRIVAYPRVRQERYPQELGDYITTIEPFKREPQKVDKFKIFVTTCNLAGQFQTLNVNFDFVLVDEAGHAQEPDILIANNLLRPNGSLVLAGDPYQLGPVSMAPKTEALENSILERLLFRCKPYQRFKTHKKKPAKFNENYITQLTHCHRSTEQVMRVNNLRFYDNSLKFTLSTPVIIKRIFEHINGDCSLVFDTTSGIDACAQNKSYSNQIQAEQCLAWLKLFYRYRIKPDQIAIISPYSRQVALIKETIDKTRTIESCKVATVDEIQGQERLIVIVSTVRSYKDHLTPMQNLGFMADQRRFNVATSRAQACTIVIGDKKVLIKNKNWKAFIEQAQYATCNDRR